MNYELLVMRGTRVLKSASCLAVAAMVLRTGYRLPESTSMMPELMCTATAFFLGLTALAMGFGDDPDPRRPQQ